MSLFIFARVLPGVYLGGRARLRPWFYLGLAVGLVLMIVGGLR